ncbi:MAG: hypothetical protein HY917_04425, partial [Candidatus Diapherotrites archaeon]|nr:hypothetical protein [Candidatus Diapherotrites archaeon]
MRLINGPGKILFLFLLFGLLLSGCVQQGQSPPARVSLQSDTIIADVTVTDLVQTDFCPSHQPDCPTDTNPLDSGKIRVDHIITYRRGDAAAKQYDSLYPPLTEGTVMDADFLYSSRPAKVRYTPPVAQPGGSLLPPVASVIPSSSGKVRYTSPVTQPGGSLLPPA